MSELFVISVSQHITQEEADRIRAKFIDTMKKSSYERTVILGEGASITKISVSDDWWCDYCHTPNRGYVNCVACGAPRVRVNNL